MKNENAPAPPVAHTAGWLDLPEVKEALEATFWLNLEVHPSIAEDVDQRVREAFAAVWNAASAPDLARRVEELEGALRQIADDCDEVSRVPGVHFDEARTWRSVAATARRVLAKEQP